MASTVTDSRERKYRSLATALENAGVSVETRGVAEGISAAKKALDGLLARVPLWLRIEYAVQAILCGHPELPEGSPAEKLRLEEELEGYVPFEDVMSVSASITDAVVKALRPKRRKRM